MNFGQNLYQWFLSNAQSLVLMSIVVIGIYLEMCIRDSTWVTKTIAETDSDGTTHYITKLADAYKVSGDSFYMQDGKAVLPLGTLTVEETKAPNGYLLEGAYMPVSYTHLDVYKRQFFCRIMRSLPTSVLAFSVNRLLGRRIADTRSA